MSAEKPVDQSELGMDIICRFAGHLAHEINNLLTPITACGQMLLDGIKPDDPLYFCAEQVCSTGDRFLDLSRKLQIIGSKRSAGQVIDLPSLLHEAVKSVSLPSGNVRIVNQATVSDAAHGMQIKIDMEQFIFLIKEMTANAASVMPQGGNIYLTIAHVADTGQHDVDRPPHGWVRLSIRDEGSGMTSEVKARMYEPYFSTFGNGRDKGLGLTLVYGIVRRAGGVIECETAPGAGTTFNIFFPRISDTVGG